MIKAIFIICVAALCAGYYLEYMEHLLPCLLCVAQRLAYFATALFAGLFCLLQRNKIMQVILYVGMGITTVSGIFFAGKQLYIESLPVELRPSCTIPFESLIHNHQWIDAFMQLMQGTSDCGTKQWVLLDMSLAFWSGCIFVVLLGLVIGHARKFLH